jgi:transketolase
MKPVAVWFKTIKGKGNQATEKSASGGHGFPLKNGEKIIEFVSEIFSGNPPAELLSWAQSLNKKWQDEIAARMNAPTSLQTPVPMKKAKVQDGLALGAIKAAESGLPVVSVAADLAGSTRICLFNDKYPERSFDMGVSESNMASVGVGLSKAGLIPIIDTFAQFGITKGNLPLMMASLSQAPVIGVFTHSGFQDAADGASHQATTYLSATASIPHVVDVVISSAEQGEAYMLQAIQRIADAKQAGQDGETVLFFAGREDFPVNLGKDLTYEWGKAIIHRDGTDVVLLATGPMVPKAQSAAKKLEQSGIKACVIENAFVNRVDVATIGSAVKACKGRLVTIEDHQIALGMGAMAVHSLSRAGITCNVESIGINGEFGRSSYKADQLYAQYGLSVDDIVDRARAVCG